MAGEKADMVFTDPPYNVPIRGHVSGLGAVKHDEFAMASGEMDRVQFTAFLQSSLSQMAAHARDGAILFTCMDWRHMGDLLAAGDEVGLELKNLCVWNKDNGGMGSCYRSKHELVFMWNMARRRTSTHLSLVNTGATAPTSGTTPGSTP
jgi:DNA modification methylase